MKKKMQCLSTKDLMGCEEGRGVKRTGNQVDGKHK